MTFFSPQTPTTHPILMHFPTMIRRGAPPPGGGRRPKAAAPIVVKCIEIACVGGSGGLKNVIACLQHSMGGNIAPPCERAQGLSISYLG